MDVPLHHEAKTADLLTDILAPVLHRDSDISDLIALMESADWWDEWTEDPNDHGVIPYAPPPSRWLNRAEDDELRHLIQKTAARKLRAAEVDRLIELRLRDRRKEVRPPRESF